MTDLQKELLAFVNSCEVNGASGKKPKTLRDVLTEELLRQIMRGEREIGDIATNSETGDVFVRFCFTEGNHEKLST